MSCKYSLPEFNYSYLHRAHLQPQNEPLQSTIYDEKTRSIHFTDHGPFSDSHLTAALQLSVAHRSLSPTQSTHSLILV